MLNQATGQNVANQAALMAGQRGAGANVGLIARQAAQQGAATQQQAVGQGATMQANQALNALGQAGSLANTQASNLVGQTNANTSAQQQEQSNLLNALQGYNSNQVSMQGNINSANAGLANTNMQGQQGVVGGLANVGSSIAGLFASGGVVPKYADGEYVSAADATPPSPATLPAASPAGGSAFTPQSKFAQFLKPGAVPQTSAAPSAFNLAGTPGATALQSGISNLGAGIAKALTSPAAPAPQFHASDIPQAGTIPAPMADLTSDVGSTQMNAAEGGKVPALVSPGEKYLRPQDVAKAKQGINPMKLGETIPGKPKVGGATDSYANDTVPKTLEEGGIVLPRSVTQSKNPGAAAKRFMDALQAHKKAKA